MKFTKQKRRRKDFFGDVHRIPPQAGDMKVTFTKPTPDMLIQAIPSAVMTTLSVLLTGDEFLKRLDDNSLEKPFQEAEKITAPK